MKHNVDEITARQQFFKRIRFLSVYGEIPFAAHLNNPIGKPALVLLRHPFGGILPALTNGRAPVHLRGGKCEVIEVTSELLAGCLVRSAQAAVVGLEVATMCSISICWSTSTIFSVGDN